MTARHNIPLARQVAADITAATCKDRGKWWSRKEKAHEKATTPHAAAAAAAPALRLCRRCPAYDSCEIWAQLDNYTGLAAGAAYLNGRRLDTSRVRQRPNPPNPRNDLLNEAS